MFSSLVDVNLVLFCDRVETSMKNEDFEERRLLSRNLQVVQDRRMIEDWSE